MIPDIVLKYPRSKYDFNSLIGGDVGEDKSSTDLAKSHTYDTWQYANI